MAESATHHDEELIRLRNKLTDYEENLKKLEEQRENNIKNGFIHMDGYEIPFSERLIRDRISLMLPTDFKEMEPRYAELKYPAYRNKESLILTNEDMNVNFFFEFNGAEIKQEQIETVRDQLYGLLLKLHPSMLTIEKAVIQTDTTKIGFFEIVTPALDKDIYNFMYIFGVGDRLVIASFNCLDDEKSNWQPIIRQIAEGLEIKGEASK